MDGRSIDGESSTPDAGDSAVNDPPSVNRQSSINLSFVNRQSGNPQSTIRNRQ
jgi:hypothetical protein